MINSKYDAASINQFTKFDLNANFQGAQFSPTKGTTTNCDFKVVDDHLIDGGRLITSNVVLGDTITGQFIDIDNVMGLGAGTVLKTFITNWPLYPGSNIWDFSVNYPAKIYGGLYIRIIYNSIGGALDLDPKMSIGYRLHKILW